MAAGIEMKKNGTVGGIAILFAAIILAGGLVASAYILSRGMIYLGDSIKIGSVSGKTSEIIVKHGKASRLEEMGFKPMPYLPPVSDSK